ncbi:Sel1 repeat protein [Pseudomonas sp. GM49]|uniref:SEL1-like repeat protein n=1 Tax=Pseudomonas sp. GM49 TaxID=1144331 RepID=UPI000270063B|nr:Sel1 repeat protein [Pseudomonas sp. GM49]
MRRVLLLTCLLLVACDTSNPTSTSTKETPLNPLTEVKAKLAFSCVHEQVPAASAEADVLFHYARWLQKNNQLKQDKAVDAEIERLYRIASENGHYKANINLQNGAMRGNFGLRGEEQLRMSEQLINAGVATGYYFVGIFLQHGVAGLKQDHEMALRYYRKAADEGNPLAQAYVADKLAPINIAPDVARKMRRCAAEQGHGDAASDLGVDLSTDGYYQEALEGFQLGVAAGDSTSASFLSEGFRGPEPDDRLYYLGQQEDLERADRYKKIWKILSGYSYANPKVPEINEIVPLPPAKLPAWDGKLKWLEERLANVPPEKPSEVLINQLAKAKLLDPATGQGLPGSPAFSQSHLSAPNCYSGQVCPVSGYWKVGWLPRHHSVDRSVARYFKQGEILPTQLVEHYQMRTWPFSDKITRQEQVVEWYLLG